MNYKWVVNGDCDESEVNRLITELGVPRVLAQILLKRGIDCFDKARVYFRPDLEKLHNPFLMKDMDKAVERLNSALQNGEKILIYGDYDVDGVSSVSLLYLALSRMVGPKISYHIPDRITDGYGLSQSGIRQAAEQGISLIVSIDCGVTAISEIELANELGIDVVVCDHHQPGDRLPPAVAVLDPKRPDCQYPFKELAGVGVGFKLLQALYQRLELPEAELDEFLDLVAIGSCADIVPLVDENRIMVRHGLDRINYHPRYGVKALLESSGLDRREMTVGLIVFIFAPRINAVGRMGDARRAVQLLTTNSLQRARELAKELEKENKNRRNVDELTYKEALDYVENQLNIENDFALVLHKKDWHPGVIGIVASRIVEKFYRPTIMISIVDGIGKGSARSIKKFNIYDAIKECSDLLIDFGGHKYAAGLTIAEEKIPAFTERFKEVAKKQILPEDLIPLINVDAEVQLSEFDSRLLRLIKLMGPFGPLNMRPIFMSRSLQVIGQPTIVGNNHLKLRFGQNGVEFDAIGFNMGDHIDLVEQKCGMLDCVYVLEENHWNGRKEVQIRLKDIK